MAASARLSKITRIQDNEYNLRQLVEQIKTPLGVIPFVGAGLSKPFGFPVWSDFLMEQAAKAGIQDEILLLLNSGEYEQAAEVLLNKRGYLAFHDAIDNSFSDVRLDGVKLRGPILILPQIAAGPVITTNFDHAIETAFRQCDNEFQSVVWGVKADLATKALQQNRRFLLKIHGDSDDSTERILTKSEYEKQYCQQNATGIDFARPLPRLLRQMLVSRPLLFLGCSLKQDRTVDVLGKVVQNDRSIAHYAVLEQPATGKEFMDRSQFLSDHNVRPIWYPFGEHDFLEVILNHLVDATATRSEPRIARRNKNRPSTARPGGRKTGLSALEIAQHYNFPAGLDGEGQCIALIELGGGYNLRDLRTYFSALHLPLPRISAVSVAGAKNSPARDFNIDAEVMMNIQVCGAVAPGARIVVYFAPNTNQGFLDAIQTAISDDIHKPSVVSISWGGPESSWGANALESMDRALQSAAAAGITVCCASGEQGASDGVSDGAAHVDFPASSPYVLACGGTQSTGIASKADAEEAVWNDRKQGASGGGISEHFPMPTWQAGANLPRSVNPGAPVGRGVPDVAALASPSLPGYRVVINGQWVSVGGTAAAAPLWAGLIARINQGLGRRVGYFNPILYTRLGPAGVLREVVTGNNSSNGIAGYQARPGWNPCTGWGTPDGAHLLSAFKLLGDLKP